MPTTAQPEGVPFNIWLADLVSNGSDVRCQLATRLIENYTPPAGLIADVSPGRGETLAAATTAGRRTVMLRAPGRDGPVGRPDRGWTIWQEGFDLAVVVPPACRLAPPRPHPLSALTAGVFARRAASLLQPGGLLALGSLGHRPADTDPATAAVVVFRRR